MSKWATAEDPRGGFRLASTDPEAAGWFVGSGLSEEEADALLEQVTLVEAAWHAAETVREASDEFAEDAHDLAWAMADAAYDLHSKIVKQYEERNGEIVPFAPRVVE